MRSQGTRNQPERGARVTAARRKPAAIRSQAPVAVLSRARGGPPRIETQRKLDDLLEKAASLIARNGYEQTAIRDVGRETGVSLAGLYYYFKNKEDLLYQIQYRTFASLLESQEAVHAAGGTAKERLRRLIVGHLAFFDRHPNEMKVCTFEFESLRDELYASVEEVRRRYYRLVLSVIEELMDGATRRNGKKYSSRHVSLFVFGMLNWVFMWYDPARDVPVEALGEEMVDLVLDGIGGGKLGKR